MYGIYGNNALHHFTTSRIRVSTLSAFVRPLLEGVRAAQRLDDVIEIEIISFIEQEIRRFLSHTFLCRFLVKGGNERETVIRQLGEIDINEHQLLHTTVTPSYSHPTSLSISHPHSHPHLHTNIHTFTLNLTPTLTSIRSPSISHPHSHPHLHTNIHTFTLNLTPTLTSTPSHSHPHLHTQSHTHSHSHSHTYILTPTHSQLTRQALSL